MKIDEIKRRVAEEADFVNCKRFNYSLDRLVEKYPDGAPSYVIAQALAMTEPEVEELYQKAILQIRTHLKV